MVEYVVNKGSEHTFVELYRGNDRADAVRYLLEKADRLGPWRKCVQVPGSYLLIWDTPAGVRFLELEEDSGTNG